MPQKARTTRLQNDESIIGFGTGVLEHAKLALSPESILDVVATAWERHRKGPGFKTAGQFAAYVYKVGKFRILNRFRHRRFSGLDEANLWDCKSEEKFDRRASHARELLRQATTSIDGTDDLIALKVLYLHVNGVDRALDVASKIGETQYQVNNARHRITSRLSDLQRGGFKRGPSQGTMLNIDVPSDPDELRRGILAAIGIMDADTN